MCVFFKLLWKFLYFIIREFILFTFTGQLICFTYSIKIWDINFEVISIYKKVLENSGLPPSLRDHRDKDIPTTNLRNKHILGHRPQQFGMKTDNTGEGAASDNGTEKPSAGKYCHAFQSQALKISNNKQLNTNS